MKNSINKTILIFPVLIGLLSTFFIYIFFVTEKYPSQMIPKDAVVFSNKSIPKSILFSSDNKDHFDEIQNGNVLLIFLSTKCEACIKDVKIISESVPDLNANLKIYGIGFEKPETIQKFIDKYSVKFPILLDQNGNLLKQLQVKYFPTKYYLKNGIIKQTWFGNFRDSQHFFDSLAEF